VLQLPKFSGDALEVHDSVPVYGAEYHSVREDRLSSLHNTTIGVEGMKIDRMYFERFEQAIIKHPAIKEKVEEGKWDELLSYIEQHILNKPEDYFTLEKLRTALNADRRIQLREMIEKIFGIIPYFKTKEELLDDEFDKFDSVYLPKEEYFIYAKIVFKAYIDDSEFRAIIEQGNFAYLNVNSSGEAFQKLPPELQRAIPEYIKRNIHVG
jgi:type I restriction enzyme R subunit